MNTKLFTKKILTQLTAIALFVGVGLVYGFTSADKAKSPKGVNGIEQKATKAFATYYFKYNGTTDTESGYENASNWQYISTTPPSSNPCSGEDFVCVLETDDIAAATPAALVSYLTSLTSAATYCRDAANQTYLQE